MILNACDPWLNPPIFAAAAARRLHLPRHGDDALRAPSRAAVRADGRDARRRPVRRRRGVGGRGPARAVRDRRRAGALGRLRPLRGRPPVLRIDEVGVRDGADLEVDGHAFAPTFSIWTTIEECLNPPVIWERERGWFTTAPFSEPELFEFPAGIGPVECVNVEHEEVVLIPRWVDCRRVTFKYGLGEEFIGVLKTLEPARARLDRAAAREGRRGGAARRRRGRAARSRDARRPDDGQDVRGDARDRYGQGRWPAGRLPAPRGRQRVGDGARRRAGRRLADRGQPGRGDGAARLGRVAGRGRARARRRSTRSRSSNCSPSTARRTGSTSATPPTP